MPGLTTKELAALEDQIGLEKMLSCKYSEASQNCNDATLKGVYQQYSQQHEQNYTGLLGYLKS